ncbi:MAG TPA: tRNA (adenosine(37)-N6)-dimethylallyltransferase MiaA, partial [Candidatus Paceibacterota bacterium]|nr:tRNA (adenosine(37)-N6)-dimethylallyltransferase MiaA [Candidatus Paceibacterota bacterium]
MDIGTGKVSKKEQRLVKHHLIDIIDPKNPPAGGFSVAQYKKLGEKVIADILKRGKIPIIVGGTGFYINALLGQHFPEVPPNKKLRAKLEKQTAEQLFQQLKKLDPRRATNIDAKNRRRLIRALEIVFITGKPITKIEFQSKYNVLWLGLNPKNLREQIIKRLEQRLRQGMIQEVKKLHAQGVSYRRLENFGLEYRWTAQYLQKKISLPEMKEGLLRAIFQYAKRQMTWFKRNKDIHWIANKSQALNLAQKHQF